MRGVLKSRIVAAVCAVAFCGTSVQAWSLGVNQASGSGPSPAPRAPRPDRGKRKPLSREERSSVISVAMHSKNVRSGGRDCSHLVHAIYERAGFSYAYADSEDLYAGVEGFQRVPRPQAADLVVWHGHVGIVTRPAHHAFFSFLSGGPGIDDYNSRYWRGRGEPRFYRYIKGAACTGCAVARRNGE